MPSLPPMSDIDAIVGADGPMANISLTPFDQGAVNQVLKNTITSRGNKDDLDVERRFCMTLADPFFKIPDQSQPSDREGVGLVEKKRRFCSARQGMRTIRGWSKPSKSPLHANVRGGDRTSAEGSVRNEAGKQVSSNAKTRATCRMASPFGSRASTQP